MALLWITNRTIVTPIAAKAICTQTVLLRVLLSFSLVRPKFGWQNDSWSEAGNSSVCLLCWRDRTDGEDSSLGCFMVFGLVEIQNCNGSLGLLGHCCESESFQGKKSLLTKQGISGWMWNIRQILYLDICLQALVVSVSVQEQNLVPKQGVLPVGEDSGSLSATP